MKKLIHRPEQKGPLYYYWIAIYQYFLAVGQTIEDAKNNILN